MHRACARGKNRVYGNLLFGRTGVWAESAAKPHGVWEKWLALRQRASGATIYAYVGSSPLSAVDPMGLFEVEGYPSSVFDKRKYPANVQALYRYAAQLQELLRKNCPGNKKAQELFDKWVAKLSSRWSDPVTDHDKKITEFTAPFFDQKTYASGWFGPSFVFMHEFMHLTDSNYAKRPSTGEYIVAFSNGTSNDLPIEKDADQLVRDLLNGKCPCE